jgi:2,4-dienoyl-CoA reductase-like NADH-dependent reductase (Old Yellow Enzyme family)
MVSEARVHNQGGAIYVASLFEPSTIGRLAVRNRMMRSATGETRSDPATGQPEESLCDMYRVLAEGGVGLIVTGHAYIDLAGKAHGRMASIAEDEMIRAWRETIRPAQQAGARVMLQINHAGSSVDPAITPHPVSPSGVATNPQAQPREMTPGEIESAICAYGHAARRAREAGFDGVQIHGAHGYLVSQFLMPATNQRRDGWGGSLANRQRFLREAVQEMRRQIGPGFPVWIKLGVAGALESGFGLRDGAATAVLCAECGVDAVEISHAWSIPEYLGQNRDAWYLAMATAVRQAVGPDYPLALVAGFRTRAMMEAVIAAEIVQSVSLCRPLLAEPDLPYKLQRGDADQVACVRCDQCRAGFGRDEVMCRNAKVLAALGR